MELETLKSIWQDQEFPDNQPARDELLALLHKKSHGPINRMRRNLRKELLLVIFSYTFCIIFYLTAFNGEFSGVSWLFVGVLLYFGIYYNQKNRLLKKMQCASCEVRSNLEGQLRTLKKYLRFYYWSGVLSAPITIIIAFGLAYNSRLSNDPPFHWWRAIGLLSALIIATTVATYFVSRWAIEKFYGRHVRKLQELVREMDEA